MFLSYGILSIGSFWGNSRFIRRGILNSKSSFNQDQQESARIGKESFETARQQKKNSTEIIATIISKTEKSLKKGSP